MSKKDSAERPQPSERSKNRTKALLLVAWSIIKIAFRDAKRHALILFSLFVSFYALLCTVYSDVIIQNKNAFVRLPWKSLWETDGTRVGIRELFAREPKDSTFYIFVLDISGSIEPASMSEEWREKTTERIRKKIPQFSPNFHQGELKGIDLARIRLYLYLSELMPPIGPEESDEGPGDSFVIWTVGSEGKPIYPKENKAAKTNIKSILEAIDQAESLSDLNQDNTDFNDAFDKILSYHESYFKDSGSSSGPPSSSVMVILSDLKHDVENKTLRDEREIRRTWGDLEQNVKKLSYSNMMTDIIVVSGAQDYGDDADFGKERSSASAERTILHLFKRHHKWYNLYTRLLQHEETPEILYPLKNIERKSIEMYYTDPHYISESSASIVFEIPPGSEEVAQAGNATDFSIKLALPVGAEDHSKVDFSIYFEVQNFKEKTIPNIHGDKAARVVAGEKTEHKLKIVEDQILRMHYSGRLPSSLPLLRVTIEGDRMSYLLPVRFIKRLPAWSIRGMIGLQISIFISFLLLLWGYIQQYRETGDMGAPESGSGDLDFEGRLESIADLIGAKIDSAEGSLSGKVSDVKNNLKNKSTGASVGAITTKTSEILTEIRNLNDMVSELSSRVSVASPPEETGDDREQ